jgi:hypothetical protein
MRKSVLIIAILLASAAAQAGTRGLSVPEPQSQIVQKPIRQAEVTVLPAPDDAQPAVQPTREPARPVEVLQPVVQPKASAIEQPKAASEVMTEIRPSSTKTDETRSAAKVERRAGAKPRKKRMTTEARLRYELGRYGINW